MKLKAVVLAISLLMPGTTLAAERDPIADAFVALLSESVTRSQRLKAAEGIARFCKKYADAIPTLSPRESDWLDGELNSPRISSVLQSLELSKRYVGNNARRCVGNAEAIPSAAGAANIHIEMLAWALLSVELSNPDFHWHVKNLVRQRIIELSSEDVDLVELAASVGRAIVQKILVPHLIDLRRDQGHP